MKLLRLLRFELKINHTKQFGLKYLLTPTEKLFIKKRVYKTLQNSVHLNNHIIHHQSSANVFKCILWITCKKIQTVNIYIKN